MADDDDDVGRWLCCCATILIMILLPIIKYQKYRSAISRAVVPINNKSLKPSDSIERCDEIRWMWWWWRSEKNAWLCVSTMNKPGLFLHRLFFLLASSLSASSYSTPQRTRASFSVNFPHRTFLRRAHVTHLTR